MAAIDMTRAMAALSTAGAFNGSLLANSKEASDDQRAMIWKGSINDGESREERRIGVPECGIERRRRRKLHGGRARGARRNGGRVADQGLRRNSGSQCGRNGRCTLRSIRNDEWWLHY